MLAVCSYGVYASNYVYNICMWFFTWRHIIIIQIRHSLPVSPPIARNKLTGIDKWELDLSASGGTTSSVIFSQRYFVT